MDDLNCTAEASGYAPAGRHLMTLKSVSSDVKPNYTSYKFVFEIAEGPYKGLTSSIQAYKPLKDGTKLGMVVKALVPGFVFPQIGNPGQTLNLGSLVGRPAICDVEMKSDKDGSYSNVVALYAAQPQVQAAPGYVPPQAPPAAPSYAPPAAVPAQPPMAPPPPPPAGVPPVQPPPNIPKAGPQINF